MYWGKQNLLKSVSVSELLTMRSGGMSNKEIAESLEISVGTVYKYIGGVRKYNKRVNKCVDSVYSVVIQSDRR